MSLKGIQLCTILFSVILSTSGAKAVFGGVDTDLEMRDSLVSLVFLKGTCSGVLVAKNVAISAAHCNDMLGKPMKAVLLSKHASEKHCNTSKIIDFAYTPDAQAILPRKVHAPDVVMFQLESDLCSGKAASIDDKPLVPGDRLELTGFGGGSGIWYKSKQISMEIIAAEGTRELVNTNHLSPGEHVYFTDLFDLSLDYYQYAIPIVENTTSCNGDSGGPLFVNNNGRMELHAINGAVFQNTELGAESCNHNYLHLVTPIAPYFDWIQLKIKLWQTS